MPLDSSEVLLISDDEDLAGLAHAFGAQGFGFTARRDMRGGLQGALTGGHCLVLLDAALVDGHAFDTVRRIRTRSGVPLVMIGTRPTRTERIAGLEAGADDYWEKPLDLDEVLARARALLRRSGLPPVTPGERLVIGGIALEPSTRRASLDGETLPVTSLEYDVLEYLVRTAGRIVSRDELMAAVVQREASPLDRALDVHISRLRKKLGSRRALIQTVRGAGYVFNIEPGS